MPRTGHRARTAMASAVAPEAFPRKRFVNYFTSRFRGNATPPSSTADRASDPDHYDPGSHICNVSAETRARREGTTGACGSPGWTTAAPAIPARRTGAASRPSSARTSAPSSPSDKTRPTGDQDETPFVIHGGRYRRPGRSSGHGLGGRRLFHLHGSARSVVRQLGLGAAAAACGRARRKRA
jgi:hypothetical protein